MGEVRSAVDVLDRIDRVDSAVTDSPVVWKDLGAEGSNPRRTAAATVDAALGASE